MTRLNYREPKKLIYVSWHVSDTATSKWVEALYTRAEIVATGQKKVKLIELRRAGDLKKIDSVTLQTKVTDMVAVITDGYVKLNQKGDAEERELAAFIDQRKKDGGPNGEVAWLARIERTPWQVMVSKVFLDERRSWLIRLPRNEKEALKLTPREQRDRDLEIVVNKILGLDDADDAEDA
jgi:hypothetical protein